MSYNGAGDSTLEPSSPQAEQLLNAKRVADRHAAHTAVAEEQEEASAASAAATAASQARRGMSSTQQSSQGGPPASGILDDDSVEPSSPQAARLLNAKKRTGASSQSSSPPPQSWTPPQDAATQEADMQQAQYEAEAAAQPQQQQCSEPCSPARRRPAAAARSPPMQEASSLGAGYNMPSVAPVPPPSSWSAAGGAPKQEAAAASMTMYSMQQQGLEPSSPQAQYLLKSKRTQRGADPAASGEPAAAAAPPPAPVQEQDLRHSTRSSGSAGHVQEQSLAASNPYWAADMHQDALEPCSPQAEQLRRVKTSRHKQQQHAAGGGPGAADTLSSQWSGGLHQQLPPTATVESSAAYAAYPSDPSGGGMQQLSYGLMQDQLDFLSMPAPDSPPPVSKVKPVSCGASTAAGSSASSTPARAPSSGYPGSPPQYRGGHYPSPGGGMPPIPQCASPPHIVQSLAGLSQAELDEFTGSAMARGVDPLLAASYYYEQQQLLGVPAGAAPSMPAMSDAGMWSQEPSSPQAAQLRNRRRGHAAGPGAAANGGLAAAEEQQAAAAAAAAMSATSQSFRGESYSNWDPTARGSAPHSQAWPAGMAPGMTQEQLDSMSRPSPPVQHSAERDEPSSPQAEALRMRKFASAHARGVPGVPPPPSSQGGQQLQYDPRYGAAYPPSQQPAATAALMPLSSHSVAVMHSGSEGISQQELDMLSRSVGQAPQPAPWRMGGAPAEEPGSPQAQHHVRIKRAGATRIAPTGTGWDPRALANAGAAPLAPAESQVSSAQCMGMAMMPAWQPCQVEERQAPAHAQYHLSAAHQTGAARSHQTGAAAATGMGGGLPSAFVGELPGAAPPACACGVQALGILARGCHQFGLSQSELDELMVNSPHQGPQEHFLGQHHLPMQSAGHLMR
mmetsp:Transcript_10192/g.22969  ORF Transcript_10192/g.22969 Transcript_10192/m.22969 type:complete len:902 (+) Transcript_10192:117-2822(+)